jgi:hypothetical protein
VNESGIGNIPKRSLRRIILIGVAVMFLLIFISVKINQYHLSNWTPPETMIGNWTGQAEVFAPYTKEEAVTDWIDTKITIAADGTVTGQIGQAELVNCTVRRNRTWFERLIGIKNDFTIDGCTLENGLDEQDGISKREIRIPFDLTGKEIKGSVFVIEQWKYPDPLMPFILLGRTEN